MKKDNLKLGALLYLCLAAALLVSCAGDDGAPGPAGTNGTNGTNGKNGADGKSGSDGLGLEDNLAYGKVTVDFDGIRPDGKSFTYTQEFPYASSNLFFSSLQRSVESTDNDNLVSVMRFPGYDMTLEQYMYPAYAAQSSSSLSAFEGQYNQTFMFSIVTPVKFQEERKYFTLYITGVEGGPLEFSKYYDENGQPQYYGEVEDAEILSYTNTPGNTGKIGYKYTCTIPASRNNTDRPLKITVTADVTVFENLSANRNSEGPARLPMAPKMEKAVMLPM